VGLTNPELAEALVLLGLDAEQDSFVAQIDSRDIFNADAHGSLLADEKDARLRHRGVLATPWGKTAAKVG
jgi:hypothetical protein